MNKELYKWASKKCEKVIDFTNKIKYNNYTNIDKVIYHKNQVSMDL